MFLGRGLLDRWRGETPQSTTGVKCHSVGRFSSSTAELSEKSGVVGIDGRYHTMGKLRITAVFVTALLVTVSVSVIASANISPQSLNAPSRNQGADLNNVGAQKPIFGVDTISGGDDVCLPHIPNAPRRRDKPAPR